MLGGFFVFFVNVIMVCRKTPLIFGITEKRGRMVEQRNFAGTIYLFRMTTLVSLLLTVHAVVLLAAENDKKMFWSQLIVSAGWLIVEWLTNLFTMRGHVLERQEHFSEAFRAWGWKWRSMWSAVGLFVVSAAVFYDRVVRGSEKRSLLWSLGLFLAVYGFAGYLLIYRSRVENLAYSPNFGDLPGFSHMIISTYSGKSYLILNRNKVTKIFRLGDLPPHRTKLQVRFSGQDMTLVYVRNTDTDWVVKKCYFPLA